MKALDDMAQMIHLSNNGMNMLTVDMAMSLINKLRRDANADSKPKQLNHQKTQGNAKAAQKAS